jgi:hypothetical protein
VPEKAEEEDWEDGSGVVEAEVVEVPFDSDGGFVEGVREGEGLENEEVLPWAARRVVGKCGGAWGSWREGVVIVMGGSWSGINGRHWHFQK